MRNRFLSLMLAAVCLGNTGSIAKSLKNEEVLNEVSDKNAECIHNKVQTRNLPIKVFILRSQTT